jgi:type I restriction enzyme R subunit
MPGMHTERTLQDEILAKLEARGWVRGLGSKAAGKYDLKRTIYPEDVIAWITSSSPKEWAKVQSMHNGDAAEKVTDRLVATIEQQGTIRVLRDGFRYVAAHFDMCAFAPNSGLNLAELERTKGVILRVVPELEYSESNGNRLDLAFFVNGIPVATAELKTDNTQTIADAVRQYRCDRLPKDPMTKKGEPLLTWKRGALVHFAVSSSEVQMTTKLDGPKTYFLPFNRGNHGGAGNPPAEGIEYLWNDILNRDAWLDILAHFICVERKEKVVDGKKVRSEILLFPRYHQWDVVTKLVKAAREVGAGQNYLVQHSAGSGKSNSIMWLAHRLSVMHDAEDKKVFDSVFVLTDRRVLDEQLADAVHQFKSDPGVIARVDGRGDSKSDQLAEALGKRAPIIIVTLQTIPFVLEKLQGTPEWQGRRFAIIADEAHSSQSGAAATAVRDLLGLTSADGDVGLDDELAATMRNRAHPKNLSYFAFTATPKPKTIEIFGRKGADGTPQPFHVYSMRQAIEEGFIVDVLQNYTTYKMAYRVATTKGDRDVPKSEAAKLIARMAKLHPYAIGQKVAIVVEHFRGTVASLLGGRAKAMVVTDSREAAFRYKLQMDSYIKEKGYDVRTLVAFSGEVTVDGVKASESSMNGIKSDEIPEEFDSARYQVLIVAEKFQTGFDQPFLCGMYVDKKLEGLAAVQTLSRLNRAYHGPFGDKEATYILDFVNDADRIQKGFLPYYETATIDENTDPNQIHDLINAIDDYGMPHLYASSDIDHFAAELRAQSRGDKLQSKLNAIIDPIRDRFMKRVAAAKKVGDTQATEEADLFRRNIRTFIRAYQFLSQLYDFDDVAIGKREEFYRWLSRAVRSRETGERANITDVTLTHLRISKTFGGSIDLDGSSSLHGAGAIGTAEARAVEFGPLSEVIRTMNELFGSDVSEDNIVAMGRGIFRKAIEDPSLSAQAKNNTREKFRLGGVNDRIKALMTETYIEAVENNTENSRQMEQIKTLLSEGEKFRVFAKSMGDAIYDVLTGLPDVRPKVYGAS